MISNHYNIIEDYQRNDLILPQYDPIKGQIDFLDDKHLSFCQKYLDMLAGLESTISEDNRRLMDALSYDQFLKRRMQAMNPNNASIAPKDEF